MVAISLLSLRIGQKDIGNYGILLQKGKTWALEDGFFLWDTGAQKQLRACASRSHATVANAAATVPPVYITGPPLASRHHHAFLSLSLSPRPSVRASVCLILDMRTQYSSRPLSRFISHLGSNRVRCCSCATLFDAAPIAPHCESSWRLSSNHRC